VRALKEQRLVDDVEMGIVKPDGTTTWIGVTAAPLPLEGHGVVVTYGDITERKLADDRQQLLLSVLEHSQDFIGVAAMDQRAIYVNPAGQRMVGLEGDAAVEATRIEDYFFPEDLPFVRKTILPALMHEGRWAGEFRFRHFRTGEPISVHYDFFRTENPSTGEFLNYCTVTRDITERKRAEEDLRQNRALLKLYFDNLPALFFVKDLEGRITDVNQAFERAVAIPKDQIVGKTDFDFHPAEEAAATLANDRLVARTGRAMQFEEPTPLADGVHVFRSTKFPIRDEDGRVVATAGIAFDVTEQTRLERDYRALFGSMLDGFAVHEIVCDDEGRPSDYRFLDINPAFERLTGLGRDIIGKTALEALPGIEPHWIEAYGRVALTGEPVHFEDFAAGLGKWFEVTAFRNAPGQFTCAFTDVTERKAAEEALRESERLLREVADNYPNSYVSIVEKDLTIGFTSGKEFRKRGLDPGGFVGLSLEEVFGDLAPIVRSHYLRAFDGAEAEFELFIDGQHQLYRAVPLTRRDGKVEKVLAVVENITERKRAEEEIHRLNTELEQRVVERTAQLEASNNELEAFAYSVSHDLRAPLRAVDGYTSILSEDYAPDLDEEGRRLCAAISRAARTMGTLIDELLAYSRLGRTELAPSGVDMRALAQAVFLELTTEEERRRVDFRLAPLPDARADRTLIRQVWLNLLDNALKFSSKREEAVIEVGCLPAGAAGGRAGADAPEGAGDPVYFVRDDGAGFDMAYADKLFGVFQRLHSDREFPGTGVGLATVQRIVQRHGGRVWAQAEPEQGATFLFSLPSLPLPIERE
jgi:PAS domain S-box-containing protein